MKIEKIQRGKAAPYSDRFERWWLEHDATMVKGIPKKTAWAAWQAGAGAAATPLDQPDWELVSAEMREAMVLAQRHGLCIMSVPGTKDRRVTATRLGKKPIYVQVSGWREMIDVLNDMAKRGAL